LRQTGERHSRSLAERDACIRALQAEVAAQRRDPEPAPLRADPSAQQRLDLLAASCAQLGARNLRLESRLGGLRNDNLDLATRVANLTEERDALEALVCGAEEEVAAPDCDNACDSCGEALAGRCVLCVGGRVPLLPQYRQLADRLGVRLIHHDGGKEESMARLPALLASSDAVICPTDCVSHRAYYQLKQHCKQARKPCVLVKRSGVASFAAALSRLASGQAEIRADRARP
jgi:hypothetical protein